ncbi:MAG: hypothetical protein ABSH53_04110 [Holophaga sp.]
MLAYVQRERRLRRDAADFSQVDGADEPAMPDYDVVANDLLADLDKVFRPGVYAELRKLLLVTPVQSNRGGKKEATKLKGKFDIGAVHLHSIFGMTADFVLSPALAVMVSSSAMAGAPTGGICRAPFMRALRNTLKPPGTLESVSVLSPNRCTPGWDA